HWNKDEHAAARVAGGLAQSLVVVECGLALDGTNRIGHEADDASQSGVATADEAFPGRIRAGPQPARRRLSHHHHGLGARLIALAEIAASDNRQAERVVKTRRGMDPFAVDPDGRAAPAVL